MKDNYLFGCVLTSVDAGRRAFSVHYNINSRGESTGPKGLILTGALEYQLSSAPYGFFCGSQFSRQG